MKELPQTLSEKIILLLQEACVLDNKAITELVLSRIECNQELAEHATIQVYKDKDNKTIVGLLGIINGILGELNSPLIAAKFNKENTVIEGWCLYKNFDNLKDDKDCL